MKLAGFILSLNTILFKALPDNFTHFAQLAKTLMNTAFETVLHNKYAVTETLKMVVLR